MWKASSALAERGQAKQSKDSEKECDFWTWFEAIFKIAKLLKARRYMRGFDAI